MNTTTLTVWIIAGLISIGAIWIVKKTNTASLEILDDWAAANTFQILSRQRRTFFMGPYFWKARRWDTIWFVKVQTQIGSIGYVWVRVPFFGWGTIQYEWDGY